MSDDKPKFIFEADPEALGDVLTRQEEADTFFNTLQETGIIQNSGAEDFSDKRAEIVASTKKLES